MGGYGIQYQMMGLYKDTKSALHSKIIFKPVVSLHLSPNCQFGMSISPSILVKKMKKGSWSLPVLFLLKNLNWLVVSNPLKNIGQLGQLG